MNKRLSVRVGDSVVLETPLAVIAVEPKESGVEIVDVTPKPSDVRAHVLLSNVMDRKDAVRLYRLTNPEAETPWDVLPEVVRNERIDLLRRVFDAYTATTGRPWIPEGREREELLVAVAAEVAW